MFHIYLILIIGRIPKNTAFFIYFFLIRNRLIYNRIQKQINLFSHFLKIIVKKDTLYL